MRRVGISVILILALVIFSSTSVQAPQMAASSTDRAPLFPKDAGFQAEAGGSGSSVPVIQYMHRLISDEILSISNNYANTDSHKSSIDLTAYQIPGWTLYEVLIEVDNITAIPEREVLGVSKDISTFKIEEYNVIGWRYNSLAQGFYLKPYDGQLLNYSFYYDSPIYNPAQHGWAYYSVLSDYHVSSSNLVGYTQLPTRVISGAGWQNATVPSVILDASTQYYVVINGSALIKTTYYPDIPWISESGAGTFESQQYDSRFSLWGSYSCEALLNYTYLPWNKTANAALVFSDPGSISLSLNGTPASGSRWAISSENNIAALEISTNQSVDIFHNLTLRYKNEITADTSWKAESSGNPVMWNATTSLVYPTVPETVFHFMNFTGIPTDWNATGLYQDGVPAGSQTEIGAVVHCSGLSSGTWTLTSNATNYIAGVDLLDSSDNSTIDIDVSNLVDMEIDATIEDGEGTPMVGGVTNLTILQMGTAIYAPAEIPASDGHSRFLWNISATTTGNGTHSVEVYWASGLEAGYLSEEVFVFYSTSLEADNTHIQAYADDSFYVGVDFNQVFPARGLDASLADVTYSFEGANASLDDQGGGRWDATVLTAGMSSGIYILNISARGYALDNQSLTILVDLTYATLQLNCSWSPSSSITYLESTNLTVFYEDLGGAKITDAWVNVAFESNTYNLTWDAIREVYWIELHGEDFTAIPGSIALNISAWKAGYAPQHNDTLMIDIANEPVSDFSVTWNPVDQNITFIESITISVRYNYNLEPISGASVWIELTGYDTVYMIYNSTSEQWEVTLSGSEYFGSTSLAVWANRTGYETRSNSTMLIVMEDIPSLADSWTDSSYTTDYVNDAPLTITVEDSTGSPIDDAILTITVNGVTTPYLPGDYTNDIVSPQTAGVYTVNVTMVRYGYTTTTMFLTLTVRATTQISIITPSHEYEQWSLTITANYSDYPHGTPITGATVIMTLDGVDYTLVYSAGFYVIEIVLDIAPGVYTLSMSATAPLANAASDSVQLTVDSKRGVNLELVSEGNPSIEGQLVSLSATLRYNDTSDAVIGETVHFIVTITFENGSVLVMDNSAQSGITNSFGVATWTFNVPGGTIESIEAEAHYDGSRLLWSASRTITVGAGTNPLVALFTFLFLTDGGRLIVGFIALIGVVVTAYNRVVKPKKREAKLSLENQLQMFVDLESLRHFMAVYLDRGTCVFYHPFTEERIQPDLISGFIAAITSVYGEIKGDGVRGTLEEIQYHGLRLNSYSGDKIIGILILEGEMTPLLKDRLQFFVELFENQYERDLEGWSGLIDCFDPEWIVSTLNAAFNYSWLLPHRFGPTQKVSKTNARILDYVAAVRDNRSEFYLRKLLSPLSEMLKLSEAQVLDRLLTLQDKGAIVPVGVQTVLQRQGMGLSDGHEGEEATSLKPPPEKEIAWEIEEEADPATVKEQKEELAPAAAETVEAPEPEPKEETDSMEAFVRDVESLMRKEKKKGEGDKKDKEE